MSMHTTFIGRFSINLNLMSLQCDNLSGELQDQWSSSSYSSAAPEEEYFSVNGV